MGQFSWLYSDNGKQMVDGKTADSYLLVPPPFQKQYGKFIEEECYDGYGHFDRYDVYDLVTEWNRAFLNEEMLIKPKREQYGEEKYYQSAMEYFERSVAVLKKYKSGASDKEMNAYCSSIGYEYGEWKRSIGIFIACYDEQNAALPFPIKITSKPMEYDSVGASKGDPDQGWELHDDDVYW